MAADDSNAQVVDAEIEGLRSDAEGKISELQAAASARLLPYLTQTGFDNNPSWENLRGREFGMAGLGDLPADSPELDLPPFVFNPEDYLNSDLLEKYSYESDFFDNFLDQRLRDYIDSNALFLEESVQQALFDLMHQRDLQALNDTLDAQDRMQARRGFPIPSSMTLAARNEILKKHHDTRTDRNSEITALIASKALEEKLASINAGVEMENIRSRFQLEYGKLYWNAADYIIRQYEAEVRAAIAEFQAELDLIKTKTGVDSDLSGKDLQYSQLESQKQLARLQGHVQEMTGNIQTWQQSAQMRVNAAAEAINYYSSTINASMGILNDMASKQF